MDKQLTQDQIGKVVAELTRLDQEREDRERERLGREQVAEVLKELNLPVDLLDDAMEQLRRREALERAQRKRKRIIIAIAAAVMAVILLVSVSMWRHSAALGRITGGQARITRSTDDGGSLQSVTRDGQEVFYRVMIRDAPAGESLSLTCNWIDPNGNVFDQKRFTTKAIDKSVWPAFARCQIGPAAPRGTWKVELLLDDRVLSATPFEVE